MRKLAPNLLGLCLLLVSGYAQPVDSPWVTQDSGVLSRLQGVFFTDRQQGWVVGSNGVLLVTQDGGGKWERKTVSRGEGLRDIFFLDPGRGFILGEYSIFNRTSNDLPKDRSFLLASGDSGGSWSASLLTNEELKSDDPKQYNGEGLTRLVFADDRTGWACGESGLILVTRNSGRSWVRQRVPVAKLFFDLAALDESNAWTVGGGGLILRTVDGGKNWNEQVSGVTRTLRAVHFVDLKRGWAVGSGGTIISTTNGGNRWEVQASGTAENLNAVSFISRNEGWIAGDRGTLLHTVDAGQHWTPSPSRSRANLLRLYFVSRNCGWAVGNNGTILKYSTE